MRGSKFLSKQTNQTTMKTITKNLLKSALLSSAILITPSCDSDDNFSDDKDSAGGGSGGGGQQSGEDSKLLKAGDKIQLKYEDETYDLEIIGGQQLNYSVKAGNEEFFVNGVPFTFKRDGNTINLNSPLTTLSDEGALEALNNQLGDTNSSLSQAVANLSDTPTDAELEAIIAAIDDANLGVILDYDGESNVFVVTRTELNGTFGGTGTLRVDGPVILLTDQNNLIYEGFNTGYTDNVTLQYTPTSSE